MEDPKNKACTSAFRPRRCAACSASLAQYLYQFAFQIHPIPQGGTGSTCSLLVLSEAEASALLLR